MKTPFKYRSIFLFACTLAFLASSALGFSNEVLNEFQIAEKLYLERNAQAPEKIKNALEILNQIENKAEDSTLKYKILVLASQAYFWQGFHVSSKDEKKELHKFGMEKADAAKKVNDQFAEAYYAYACNLGRWALANGILASLMRKTELEENLKAAMDRETLEGDSGDTVDGYGPYRVLGRMYLKLPGFAGGSFDLSKEYLKTAHENASDFANNTVYYAATLYQGNSKDKEEAKQLLENLLQKDPASFHLKRLPESLEALGEAKLLLASKGRYDVQ